jgi:hypothetical protein
MLVMGSTFSKRWLWPTSRIRTNKLSCMAMTSRDGNHELTTNKTLKNYNNIFNKCGVKMEVFFFMFDFSISFLDQLILFDFVFWKYILKNLIFFYFKLIFFGVYRYFDVLILKIIFKKYKKYYFNIFSSKKYFKNNRNHISDHYF